MPDLSTNVAVGDPDLPGILNATRAQVNMMRGVRVYAADPAFGGLVVNDASAAAANVATITAALAFAYAYGGGEVVLPPKPYYVSGPLSVPPRCELVGEARVTLNLDPNSVPAGLTRLIADAGWAPTSSAGVVEFRSRTPGGWSEPNAHCGLRGIAIDLSLNSDVDLNGVFFNGPVYDPHLEDVFIWKSPHNGVHAAGVTESGITPTFAYHVRMRRVTVANPVNTGFNVVNFTDSVYTECLAFSPGFHGWAVQNCSNSTWLGCRAEWSQGTGRGLNITGSNGGLTFVGFTTDQNNQEGVRITAATNDGSNGGGIVFVGCKLHADGRAGSSSGLKITGSSVPVLVSGLVVEVGSAAPTNGVSVDTSSNVLVTGSILQGITAAWVDGGGNSNIMRTTCMDATGAPGSQVLTPLANLGGSVQYVVKPSDQVLNNQGALQNDSALSAAVAANAVYDVQGYVIYDATSTADLKLGWTVPSGATGHWVAGAPGTGASASPFPLQTGDLSFGASVSVGAVGVGTKIVALIRGKLATGATAGTLQLQWCQNAAEVSNTTVYTDSYLRLERVS